MANQSVTYGTITFQHGNANPALIEKLIEHTNEEFYYGSLLFPDRFNFDDPTVTPAWAWDWGEIYDFESSGRWSFHSTITSFFENFNDVPFKTELEGLEMKIDFVDFEVGNELFMKESLTITAVLDKDGNLTTSTQEHSSMDIAYNAENVVSYRMSDWAMDTLTEYGVRNYLTFIERYLANDPNAFIDNPELHNVLKNIRQIPIKDLLQAFNDNDVEMVADYEPEGEEDYIITPFVEELILEHELIVPYTK